MVCHESWTAHLLQRQVHAAFWGREVVTGVVEQGEAGSYVCRGVALSAEKLRGIDMVRVDVIERECRAYEQVARRAKQPAGLHLRLATLELALVVIVVALVKSHSPKIAWEGIEICGIVNALAVTREYMCATYANHVETHG